MIRLVRMGVGTRVRRMEREGKMNPSSSVIFWLLERQQRRLEKSHSWQAPQSNSSRLGQKERLPTEMLPCSVCLLGLFPGLAGLQEDLDQRQEDGHSHRQEERDVDGKLLVIREIEEVEKGWIKKGTL